MGVNITTIAYLRVLIIEIGSTIFLMVVEAQGIPTSSLTIIAREKLPKPNSGSQIVEPSTHSIPRGELEKHFAGVNCF